MSAVALISCASAHLCAEAQRVRHAPPRGGADVRVGASREHSEGACLTSWARRRFVREDACAARWRVHRDSSERGLRVNAACRPMCG